MASVIADQIISDAITDVVNYLFVTRGGTSEGPGSHLWFTDPLRKLRLYNWTDSRVMERGGVSLAELQLSPDEIAHRVESRRKQGYKKLAKGLLLSSRPKGFFGGQVLDVSAVVYAYYGSVATRQKRLVKIGYTTQELRTYLNGKRILHKPVLLGDMPGGRETESRILNMWGAQLEEGREWFRPSKELFSWMDKTSEFSTTGDFKNIAIQALTEWEL